MSGIRYRRGPPMVRNMRAVLKKASWGTRRIFGSIRCKKQASTVREGYSVPKTAFSGTRRIFKGALNSLLLHRMHFRKRKNGILLHRTHLKRPAEQPTPQTVDSLLPHRTHFQRRAVPKTASCPPDAASVRERAPALFVRSGGPFPCPFDGTRYRKQPTARR